jgi:hypothetical protein
MQQLQLGITLIRHFRRTGLFAAAALAFASPGALAAPQPCSPEAQIAPANQVVNENSLVQLNGNPSKDETSYAWAQTAGPSVTLSSTTDAMITFTAPAVAPAGATLKFTLRVTGCSPAITSAPVETTITVLNVVNPNQPPVAASTVSPASIFTGSTVTLNGSGSSDPDGNSLTYSWVQIDGTAVVLSNANTAMATFTAPSAPYPTGATLKFRLTVSDGSLQSSTEQIVNVLWQNAAPTALVSCPASINEGGAFALDGSTSSDPDTLIASYFWSQTLGGPVANLPADMTTAVISATAPLLDSPLDTMSFKLEVTDPDGLKDAAECDVKVNDITAPDAKPTQSPAANAHGWNKTDVVVTWNWVDFGIGIDGANCTDSSTSSGEGYQLTLNATCNDLSGNEGSSSYKVNVDKSDPTISAAATTSPNGHGWYKDDLTVHFTCADSLSGILTGDCPANELLSDEGAAVSSTAQTVSDKAGNVSDPSNVVTASIDKTDPTISAAATSAPNGHGWYKHDVTVQFTCADGLSGLAGDCPVDELLSDEGAAVSSTPRTVSDKAGNVSNASNVVTASIDKTKPTISAAATTAPNGEGWYKNDVTVHFTCADGLSGILTGDCPANELLSDEGAAVSSTAQTVSDKAGNVSNSSNVVTVSIDKTGPGISWTGGINDGDSFYFGSVPAAPTCGATDGLSGAKDCAVTGYSNAVGNHTLTATAHDKAGNETKATRAYTVKAWSLNGFFQPVDMGGVSNTVKGGSTVPLKFEVFAANELTDVGVVRGFAVGKVSCLTSGNEDAIEMVTTGGTALRYDTVAGQFIQNWQTPKAAGTCYIVTMTTDDGSSLSANFKLK